ncbi:hypothetical protein AB0L57_32260 [Nocardia sp. NPDC052254]|uniref:hypothetical protein n=1 Tax=Nocardia sp. NPDC052254 TaxID=3155681 RepID=UPI003414FAE7
MVGVLIRMRWRLTARAMSNGRAAVGFWLGLVFGLLAAAMTVALMASAGHGWDARGAINVAATLYAVWTLGWLCGPVLLGSSDETLQPEHFRLLPVSSRQLSIGLAAVAVTGPAGAVNLIAFGGLVALASQLGALPTVFAVFGTVLQLAFVVLLSRVVLAWIGAAMRSRRGRDLGVLLAGLTGLAYYPLQLLLTYLGPRLEHVSPGLGITLRALPSGWAPYAVQAAAEGRWWYGLLALAGLTALVALLWQIWAVLLRRRLTTTEAPAGPVRAQAGSGRLERLVPPTPVGAVVLKELRTWWRDGRRRATLLPLILIGVVLPIFLGLQNAGATLPFAGAFVVWMAAMACANMFAFDGTALWHTLVIPGAVRSDVRGRMIAWLLVVSPLAVVLTLVMPGVAGQARLYPWVVSILPVLLGVGVAAAIFQSVYAAYPLPQQRGNPFASNTGNPGCTRALMQLAVGFGQLLVGLPAYGLLALGTFLHNALIQWCALPVGVAVGIGAAVLSARLVENRVQARGPELLAEITPR